MQRDDDVLVLVAHGTRSARGVEMVAALADAVARASDARALPLSMCSVRHLRKSSGTLRGERFSYRPSWRPATTFTPMFERSGDQ